MKEIKVKKYREIVRRMMGRISKNGKDWAKPRSTAIQAYKSPPYDQLQSSGRRNLDGGADQQLSLLPSEKEQIQKIDEAENAEASSAFSVSRPVGCIEYLGTDGMPVETVEYADAERFVRDIKEETFYGASFTLVFYRDKQGHTMSQEFLMELDPPPMGFRVEDAPVLVEEREQASRYEVVVYHHFENGFDEKLDYPTLEEAKEVAQKYVDGSMEPDGFAYEGAAVYDLVDKKYLSIYGYYPDEKAHEQLKERDDALVGEEEDLAQYPISALVDGKWKNFSNEEAAAQAIAEEGSLAGKTLTDMENQRERKRMKHQKERKKDLER